MKSNFNRVHNSFRSQIPAKAAGNGQTAACDINLIRPKIEIQFDRLRQKCRVNGTKFMCLDSGKIKY